MRIRKLLLLFGLIFVFLLLAGCETAEISLSIKANKTQFSSAGEVINYTYTIHNSGDVTLYNINFTENLLTPQCPASISPIAAGASVVCTGTHTTTAAEVQAGVVVDTASTSGTGTERGCCSSDPHTVSNSARLEIPMQGQTPSLTLTKTFSPATFKQLGEVITYSYVLQNSGVTSLSGPCSVNDDLNSVTCPSVNTILPGAHITCTGKYTITLTDIGGGSVSNTATAHCGSVTSNTVNAQILIDRQPVLSLTKTPSQKTFSGVGEQIDYTYTITNVGGVAIQGSFTLADDKLVTTCPDTSNLDIGQSFDCTASYTTKYDDLLTGVIRNTAFVITPGAVTSNTAVSEVRIVADPQMSLTKVADRSSYSHLDEVISYTYTVKNIGNVPIRAPFQLLESKVDSWQCYDLGVLNPGQTFTCTGTYTVKASDVGKTIKNYAFLWASVNQKTISTNSVTVTVVYKVPEASPNCTPEDGQDETNQACYCPNFYPDVPWWCQD
jgi:hypothetical protein